MIRPAWRRPAPLLAALTLLAAHAAPPAWRETDAPKRVRWRSPSPTDYAAFKKRVRRRRAAKGYA